MRGSAGETSSFDLFLDTICNTFGGIVFLSILLAIMIQNRSVVRSVEATEEAPSPEETRALITQLDELSAERSALQATLAQMPEVAPQQEDEEYFALVEQFEKAEERFAAALEEQVKLSEQLAEQLARNDQQKRENQQVLEDLERAESELAEAEAEYQRRLVSKRKELRLPKVRSGTAASALLLAKDGALYLARRPSLFGEAFRSEQVTATELPFGGHLIEPRSGTGWRLGTTEAQAEFQQIIEQAKREAYTLAIAVWPDSYAGFDSLRETMIAEGVGYQLWPQSESEQLIIDVGVGESRIQ